MYALYKYFDEHPVCPLLGLGENENLRLQTRVSGYDSLHRSDFANPEEEGITRLYCLCLNNYSNFPVLVLGRIVYGPLRNPTKWIVVSDCGKQVFALEAKSIDEKELHYLGEKQVERALKELDRKVEDAENDLFVAAPIDSDWDFQLKKVSCEVLDRVGGGSGGGVVMVYLGMSQKVFGSFTTMPFRSPHTTPLNVTKKPSNTHRPKFWKSTLFKFNKNPDKTPNKRKSKLGRGWHRKPKNGVADNLNTTTPSSSAAPDHEQSSINMDASRE